MKDLLELDVEHKWWPISPISFFTLGNERDGAFLRGLGVFLLSGLNK
jgi:hypothetical protein